MNDKEQYQQCQHIDLLFIVNMYLPTFSWCSDFFLFWLIGNMLWYMLSAIKQDKKPKPGDWTQIFLLLQHLGIKIDNIIKDSNLMPLNPKAKCQISNQCPIKKSHLWCNTCSLFCFLYFHKYKLKKKPTQIKIKMDRLQYI